MNYSKFIIIFCHILIAHLSLIFSLPHGIAYSVHSSSSQQQCTNILGGICVSGTQCATMNGTTVYQICPDKFSCCLAKNTKECIALKGVCMFVLEEGSLACDSQKSQFLDGVCGKQEAAKCCVPKAPPPTDVIIDFDKTIVWKIISLILGLFLLGTLLGIFIYMKREALCQLNYDQSQEAIIHSNASNGNFSGINTIIRNVSAVPSAVDARNANEEGANVAIANPAIAAIAAPNEEALNDEE